MSGLTLAVDVVLGLLFAREYIVHTLRAGRVIDLWTLTTLEAIIVPILLVGPFAASPLNYLSIGNAIDNVATEVDHAFQICALGSLGWLLGAVACRHAPQRLQRRLDASLMRFVVRTARIFSAPNVLSLLVVSAGAGLAINLAFGSGVRSLRDYMLENASVRPLFNFFVISLAPLAFVLAFAKFLDTRKRVFILGSGITAVICLFSGARSIFFTPLIWLYLAHRAKEQGGSLVKLMLIGATLVVSAMLIGALRSGGTVDDFGFLLAYGVLYGNSFSDFRDFCWYLSMTHEVSPYWGATYLAGLMSFVPTFLSSFREQFNLGVVTATAIGLSPQEHAGIRISAFGELYINFGLAGVTLGSFGISYVVKLFDTTLRRFAAAVSYVASVICIQLAQVPLILLSSNTIWSLYSFIGVACLLRGMQFCFPDRRRRRQLPADPPDGPQRKVVLVRR